MGNPLPSDWASNGILITMLTALVFLFIITTAVVVHELAHFLNARSVGLPVRAFSVGMGPVLFRRTWRGTEWRLSLFPVGGYVDIPGMAARPDEHGELAHPTDGFATKRLPAKLWVLIGGVIANFLLGVILLTWAVMLQPNYRQLTANIVPNESGATIAGVIEGSTAERLGLVEGDLIVAINGIGNPTRDQVTRVIREADGLTLVIQRGDEQLQFSTAWPPADLGGAADGKRPLLGVQLAPVEVENLQVGLTQAFTESLTFGVRILPEMVRGFVRGFGAALTGQQQQDVAGPVGMVSMVNQATQVGLAPVLLLAAIINFSLAVFNLLPIPGLDGGRMLLAIIVALRGRPFRPGQEEAIHFIGIMAVLALIVLITLNELGSIIRG